jgi:hypothetical protein
MAALRCLTGRRQGLPQFHLFQEEGHVLGGLLVIAQVATVSRVQEDGAPVVRGSRRALIRLVDQGGGLQGETFLSVAGGGIEVRVDGLAETADSARPAPPGIQRVKDTGRPNSLKWFWFRDGSNTSLTLIRRTPGGEGIRC